MGRVWFITGSSKGLGLAIAEAALADGDSVVATARDPNAVKHLVEKYGDGRVLPLALDVADNTQVESSVAAAVDKFGCIDIVINNAGYADIAPLEDSSLESFRSQINVNFLGTVYVTKAVLPILRKQQSGHVLQVSSVGGRLATPGLSAYQAAKWAVGGFTGVVAAEAAGFGIKFTTLEPGGMATDWAGAVDAEIKVSEAYSSTVGQFTALRKQYSSFASDPKVIARVIVKITKEIDPPLRLLLGLETLELARNASKQLAESDEKWKQATLLQL